MKKFTADFETATWLEDESFVWAWALCEIGNTDNLKIGNTIETFFETIKKEDNPVILFHNLKFDGEFILFHLLKNDYEHVEGILLDINYIMDNCSRQSRADIEELSKLIIESFE